MEKTVVAIIGAGGKMGRRAVSKLGDSSEYEVVLCEAHAEKADALRRDGFEVSPTEMAIKCADFVILAVPDAAIGTVTRQHAPFMKSGATLMVLDAAATYIDATPVREDLTLMIAHPCHPALFAPQADLEARDYFGGNAKQDIVVALVSGASDNFAIGTAIASAMFAPTGRAHEVTAEQFALLEPAMSEIVVATLATIMAESLELVVELGVPREAAWAFMSGHVQIAIAMVFGFEHAPFSDAAKIAIAWGKEAIVKPDWKDVFQRPGLSAAIRDMLGQ